MRKLIPQTILRRLYRLWGFKWQLNYNLSRVSRIFDYIKALLVTFYGTHRRP